jgi:hypothetical protein
MRWISVVSGAEPTVDNNIIPDVFPFQKDSRPLKILFWTETSHEGSSIRHSFQDFAEDNGLNGMILKQINRKPIFLRSHHCVVGYLAGHRRKSTNRDEFLRKFFALARSRARPFFLVVTGWVTKKGHQCDINIFRNGIFKEAVPDNVWVFTCDLSLDKAQLISMMCKLWFPNPDESFHFEISSTSSELNLSSS